MASEILRAVVGQLEVWWFGSVTMRMAGLADDEYLWKPTADAFCLRRAGDDLFYEWPPGSRGETTPPVTTIAWRMAHVAQGCFENRWHMFFGDGPQEWDQPFPANATSALEYLERWKTNWVEALHHAGEERLLQPIGQRSDDVPIMQLGHGDAFINMALHINREVMHHGAEICLLRDLYRDRRLTK